MNNYKLPKWQGFNPPKITLKLQDPTKDCGKFTNPCANIKLPKIDAITGWKGFGESPLKLK